LKKGGRGAKHRKTKQKKITFTPAVVRPQVKESAKIDWGEGKKIIVKGRQDLKEKINKKTQRGGERKR